jgi:hypothetical protein
MTSIRKNLKKIAKTHPELHKDIWRDYYKFHFRKVHFGNGYCYIGYDALSTWSFSVNAKHLQDMHKLHILGEALSPRKCGYYVPSRIPFIRERRPFYLATLAMLFLRKASQMFSANGPVSVFSI